MSTKTFSGQGQATAWYDPNNWSGGAAPGSTDRALLSGTGTHTFAGPVAAGTIMLLGAEAVTFTGAVTASDTGFCAGIMVCNGGAMTFAAGSTLHDDAGALLIGNAAIGRFTAYGTAQQQTTITSANATVGKLAGKGVGTITIDGATWNCGVVAFIGAEGNGTLDVKDGGVTNISGNLAVAFGGSSTGKVTIEAGSAINVGGTADLGQVHADGTPGMATVTVDAGGTLSVGHWLIVGPTSSLVVAGGTVHLGTSGQGWASVQQGGVITGHGVISSVSNLLTNDGTIDATGGMLEIAGRVAGTGGITIEANSTVKLDGAVLQLPTITFAGPGSSLELASQTSSLAQLSGFATGDKIVFDSTVDSVQWKGASGTLSVISGGHTVDTLHLAGLATSAAFTLQHAAGTSVISLHG